MIKNITLSAEEKLIAQARHRAQSENKSLNDAFREWLLEWTSFVDPVARYQDLMARADSVVKVAAHNRDTMNVR